MTPFEDFWTKVLETAETSIWKETLVFDKGNFITTLDIYFGKDGHPTQIDVDALPKKDPKQQMEEKINYLMSSLKKELEEGNFGNVETLARHISFLKDQQTN